MYNLIIKQKTRYIIVNSCSVQRVCYSTNTKDDEAASVSVANMNKKKRTLKIKTAAEQMEAAATQRTGAKVRRKALYSILEQMLPQHIQAQTAVTISSEDYNTQLNTIATACGIKSAQAAKIGAKILRDNIKKNLKTSGLTPREKAEMELFALIKMTQIVNALLACHKTF